MGRVARVYVCAYTVLVSFEWDPAKGRNNLRKHRVDFADAVGAFDDPRARTLDDPHPGEDRFVTIGLDFLGELVVICWTPRGDNIRLISARPATRHERWQYEQES